MSTDKGGSDLDVFNDLKPQTPDGTPILETKRTLMGLQAPEGGLPPVPGSSPTATRSIPPPPPSQRPRRSAGSGLSNPLASASPESAPSSSRPPRDEEDRAEDTSPGIPPEGAGAAPSPSRGNGLSLDAWAMTSPPGVGGRLSLPPNPTISSLPDTLASAAVPAAAGTANGDVGWDDDDDKTQVYDKDTQAAAQSLLQPALPGLIGRPPPPMSRPPGAILPPGVLPPGAAFAPRTTIPPSPQDVAYALPPQPVPSQRLPYLFAAIGAVLVATLFWVLLPKKGGLTVTVAGGPGNKELAAVEVIVDNKVRCRTSPCELPSLKSGTHYVEVRAAGYQATAKSAVAIVGGQTAVHNVQLIRAGTGIKVFGEGSGLTLLVDGKEFGPLPQELREMEPGEHVVQVAGGPRYEVFTQRIIVDPDRMTPIGPIRLKVTKGLATIRAGHNAEEAEVTLKVGDSRRVLPALPVRLEVETDRPHILIAKRRGFATFEEPITFEDGQAERTIEIALTERPQDARRPRPAEAAPGMEGSAPVEPAPPSEPVGMATLQLTSTPPSNVLLDGKPLGTTPLRDVSVEPGSHRVIFIYGAERKPKTIEASAGSNQTVSVSF
jgi:serine/threonine-protein kinase